MKKELTLLKISDDKPIREWANELMGVRNQEALDSIVHEEVSKENVFLISLDTEKYLAFYMEGNMLPADMTQSINIEHKAVLKSIGIEYIKAEPLYSLEQDK